MYKKSAISTAFLFILIAVFATNVYAGLKKGPYLQVVNKTGASVVWQTDSPAAGTVEWGMDESLGNVLDAAAGEMHEVRIEGLKTNTPYYYRVSSDGETTKIYEFWTAPEPWTPFRWIAYGDSRSGYNDHLRVTEAMIQEAPDIYSNSGDITCSAKDELCWQKHFDIEHELMATTNLLPVIGNHDVDGANADNYKKYFVTPENGYEEWQDHFYYQDWGNARFIVLDFKIPLSIGSTQASWLEEMIIEASEDSDLLHTFIFIHEGPYTAKDARSGNAPLRSMMDMFKEYNVTCIISGHDHYYYRGESSNGVNFLVTGGAGASLYDCNPTTDWGVRNIMCEKVYNYIVFDVNGRDISAVAKMATGEVLETFNWTSPKISPEYTPEEQAGEGDEEVDGDGAVTPVDGDQGNAANDDIDDNDGSGATGSTSEEYDPEFGFSGCNSGEASFGLGILSMLLVVAFVYRRKSKSLD